MKRWRIVALALISAVVAVSAVGYGWSKHVRGKQEAAYQREVGYQTALHSFDAELKPGMTRKDVEGYLQKRGIQFTRICCLIEKSAYADITRIGTEPAPWYCSEHNVYIAFQFDAAGGVSPSEDPSDTLQKTTIFPWLEGCL